MPMLDVQMNMLSLRRCSVVMVVACWERRAHLLHARADEDELLPPVAKFGQEVGENHGPRRRRRGPLGVGHRRPPVALLPEQCAWCSKAKRLSGAVRGQQQQ